MFNLYEEYNKLIQIKLKKRIKTRNFINFLSINYLNEFLEQ